MKAYPYLINQDGSGRRLIPSQAQERPYDEAWLQEVLRQHPNILPAAEIESIFSPLVSIGREVSTDSGPIDNLFISHRGYLILVETKLWRNPEARREVVAQAIDYGSSLSKWKYEKLNDAVKQYTGKYESGEMSLVDWVEQRLGPVEGGRDFFEESVAKNLRLGRFLTMIVSDKIRQPVIEMVSYVNKYPGLAMDVALVELQCFWPDEQGNWPLFVVPSIVARTEIVERSVVQVTVSGAESSLIEVRQEKTVEQATVRARVSLSEEAFWELLREQVPQAYDKAQHLITAYKDRAGEGVEVSSSGASVTVKLAAQETGKPISLFYLDKRAYLNVWPQTIGDQLFRAGFDAHLVRSYEQNLLSTFGQTKSKTDLAWPVAEMDTEQFKMIVDNFILAIRQAEPLEE